MGARESLAGRFGPGIGALILLVGIALIALQYVGGGNAAAAPARTVFYTDDNGKTFFKDNFKAAPFDHNGKQAYRADVFKSPDGKEFVGLIYRCTDAGRKEMESYIAKGVKDSDGSIRRAIEQRGMQVKLVTADDKGWALADDVTVERLQTMVRPPSGSGPVTLVAP
jgi:hypothetical protein